MGRDVDEFQEESEYHEAIHAIEEENHLEELKVPAKDCYERPDRSFYTCFNGEELPHVAVVTEREESLEEPQYAE